MASARDNQLRKQAGEHLVCAKLAKLGYLATPFAGNVPDFDIIAVAESGRTERIQVKTSSKGGWHFNPDNYMTVQANADGSHTITPLEPFLNADLIYVCVWLEAKPNEDYFYVLTRRQLRDAIIVGHRSWLAKAPRTHSQQHRYHVDDIKDFLDNWPAFFPPS